MHGFKHKNTGTNSKYWSPAYLLTELLLALITTLLVAKIGFQLFFVIRYWLEKTHQALISHLHDHLIHHWLLQDCSQQRLYGQPIRSPPSQWCFSYPTWPHCQALDSGSAIRLHCIGQHPLAIGDVLVSDGWSYTPNRVLQRHYHTYQFTHDIHEGFQISHWRKGCWKYQHHQWALSISGHWRQLSKDERLPNSETLWKTMSCG